VHGSVDPVFRPTGVEVTLQQRQGSAAAVCESPGTHMQYSSLDQDQPSTALYWPLHTAAGQMACLNILHRCQPARLQRHPYMQPASARGPSLRRTRVEPRVLQGVLHGHPCALIHVQQPAEQVACRFREPVAGEGGVCLVPGRLRPKGMDFQDPLSPYGMMLREPGR